MGKIELTCMIIDDTDQRRIFETQIERLFNSSLYELNFIPLNPIEEKFLSDDKKEIINEKVQEEVKALIKNKRVDVVATDFDFLKTSSFTGLDIVDIFLQERESIPIVLYSGNLKKVINTILERCTEKEKYELNGEEKERIIVVNNDLLFTKLRNLVQCNIKAFIERESYSADVVKILRKESLSIQKYIVDKLREHSEEKFDSFFPIYNDKTYAEIASEIEKGTDDSKKFQYELLEQLIAHLTSIN